MSIVTIKCDKCGCEARGNHIGSSDDMGDFCLKCHAENQDQFLRNGIVSIANNFIAHLQGLPNDGARQTAICLVLEVFCQHCGKKHSGRRCQCNDDE